MEWTVVWDLSPLLWTIGSTIVGRYKCDARYSTCTTTGSTGNLPIFTFMVTYFSFKSPLCTPLWSMVLLACHFGLFIYWRLINDKTRIIFFLFSPTLALCFDNHSFLVATDEKHSLCSWLCFHYKDGWCWTGSQAKAMAENSTTNMAWCEMTLIKTYLV